MPRINALKPALKALSDALRRVRAQHMVIGGVAVQARGFARATSDVDATVRGDQVELGALTRSLAKSRIFPRVDDFEVLARDNFILLLVHRPTGTPIDLSLAWLDFEQAACARATLEKFGTVTVPIICLEDLLVLKAIAWRERDQNDLRNLLTLNKKVDLEFVEAQVKAISDAIEEPSRPAALRRLISGLQLPSPRPVRKR